MNEEKNKKTTKKKSKQGGFYSILFVAFLILLAGGMIILVNMFGEGGQKDYKTEVREEPTTQSSQPPTTLDAGKIGENEIKLTDENFKKEVEEFNGVALVEFYLSTCPYCQAVADDVTAAADELGDRAKVGKIDAQANTEMSTKYEVRSVPYFVVFKNGKKQEAALGEKTKNQLVELVEKHLD